MWRGGRRLGLSVAAPFVWRCPSNLAVTPFPHPAVDRDPLDNYANFHLGNTLYLAGQFARAETALRRVLEISPQFWSHPYAAVDALVRHRFELPALIALRRLAGAVHSAVNKAQWREVCAHLTRKPGSGLDALVELHGPRSGPRHRTKGGCVAALTQKSKSVRIDQLLVAGGGDPASDHQSWHPHWRDRLEQSAKWHPKMAIPVTIA
jgi:hypothetical protein